MRRLPGLDGLRALAVLAVVLHHSRPSALPGGGVVGVDLFFVLSGFLITTLLMGEHERTGTVSLIAFYKRRARRLLPALAAMLLTVLAVELVVGGARQRHTAFVTVGFAATYVSNIARHSGVHITPALAHLWTLALEEQFYLLWPIVLVFALRRLRPQFIVAGTVGLIALTYLARYREVLGGGAAMYYSPTTWADALLIGCLAAQLDFWGYLAKARSRLLVFVGLVPFVVIAATRLQLRHLYVEELLLLAVGNAVVVVVVAHTSPRVLASKAARWVGARSYGVYLWHAPILVGCLALNASPGPNPAFALAAFVACIAVVAAGISYALIERRWMNAAPPPIRLLDRTPAVP